MENLIVCWREMANRIVSSSRRQQRVSWRDEIHHMTNSIEL